MQSVNFTENINSITHMEAEIQEWQKHTKFNRRNILVAATLVLFDADGGNTSCTATAI